ncbi:MAG: hypothetical protein U0271_15080 [Polyangiaceae bacterium]
MDWALRQQLTRLRQLGVRFAAVSLKRSREGLARAAQAFVEPEHVARVLGARAGQRIAFERFVRTDVITWRGTHPPIEWLGRGQTAVRFDRGVGQPALEIEVDTLRNDWLASWPGLYVVPDARRAVVVGIDYEILHCDASGSASPYR